MELVNHYKLEKLTLEVYDNQRREKKPEILKVMFNPESYSFTYENKFGRPQGLDSSKKSNKYIQSKPANLALKIIIDGTGVSELGTNGPIDKKDVYTKVQDFLKATANMDGNLHEPKFIKIIWGKLNFDCRLENVTVTYTLFDHSGNPLRAELDTSFIADTEKLKGQKQAQLTSPDLTHKRIVKENDTLPLLCESIYGTPDYYLKVAKANKLVNFRVLYPGQELFFPPINK